MEVDDVIVVFGFEGVDEGVEVVVEAVDLIDLGIGFQDGLEGQFCAIVNLGRYHLFFQTTDNRRCEDDVADGTETNDQEFHSIEARCSSILFQTSLRS